MSEMKVKSQFYCKNCVYIIYLMIDLFTELWIFIVLNYGFLSTCTISELINTYE